MAPVFEVPETILGQIEETSLSPDEYASLVGQMFRRIENGAWRDREGVMRVIDAIVKRQMKVDDKTSAYWRGYAEATLRWVGPIYFMEDQPHPAVRVTSGADTSPATDRTGIRPEILKEKGDPAPVFPAPQPTINLEQKPRSRLRPE